MERACSHCSMPPAARVQALDTHSETAKLRTLSGKAVLVKYIGSGDRTYYRQNGTRNLTMVQPDEYLDHWHAWSWQLIHSIRITIIATQESTDEGWSAPERKHVIMRCHKSAAGAWRSSSMVRSFQWKTIGDVECDDLCQWAHRQLSYRAPEHMMPQEFQLVYKNMTGNKHQRLTQLVSLGDLEEKGLLTSDGHYYCKDCNMWLNGKEQYEDHLVCRRHKQHARIIKHCTCSR